MPDVVQDADTPFIEVGYEAKIVFTPSNGQERLDLRTAWQQSRGLWANHPVFHGLPVREVIVWLRGADSDV
jgi:hypothetical protein